MRWIKLHVSTLHFVRVTESSQLPGTIFYEESYL